VAGAGQSTKIKGEEEVIRQKNTHKFKFLPWRGNIFPVLERERKRYRRARVGYII
jgi:hypothetical protein